MSVTYRCDNCGKEESAGHDKFGMPVPPHLWKARTPIGGWQIHACSDECVYALDAGLRLEQELFEEMHRAGV